MKIINSHCHLIDTSVVFSPENLHQLEYIKSIPTFANLDQVKEMVSLNNLLAQIDEAGIDKTVLFALEAPLLYASNEFVASICEKHPSRFIGFASINPNKKDACEQLQFAIENLSLKGLKLHPPLQNFYPNDHLLWPVYALASEMGIPVVFHVGSTPFGSLVKLKQADPLLIDDIANDFPKLKIILTHLGTLWHNESLMITEKHPNVYIDTAAYPYEIMEILTEKLIMRVGCEKFIFGTDFPMPYEGKMHRLKDFTDCILNLKISNELKERIFALNFETMMQGLL
jgi:predicted TIM-barrel fold metal-dependent hydrolase